MKKQYWVFMVFITWGWSQQSEVSNTIAGANELLKNKEAVVSEMEYRKALSDSPNRIEALYNLGNNHYQSGDFDEASQRYFETQKKAASRGERHQAFHNMGNVSMEQKDYAKAVEAFKNALRNNPADEETRYNYALAKKLLEKEKQQQDQQNKDQNKDQKKDQNKEQDPNKDQDKGDKKEQEGDQKEEGDDAKKDEKDSDKNKDDGKDSKNDPKENDSKDDKPNPQQPPKPKEGQLSPQQVKSLLEAMNNQEKKVQDKIKAKKVKETPVKGKKDW